MALYPLPALVALGGWLLVFASAGTPAIAFGVVSLAGGTALFLIVAHRRRSWPFATARFL
jgi:hypothetical protein